MPTSWSTFVTSLKHSTSKKPRPQRARPRLVEDECVACLEITQCVATASCNHPICASCLGTYISVTHHSRLPCPCPSSAICKAEFTIDDIEPFVDNEELKKIWLGQAAKQIEQGLGMYCPNPQCSKPILWSAKKGKKCAGKCRNCGQTICLPCRSTFHTNLR